MKKITLFLWMLFAGVGLFAQHEALRQVFTVQGFPREDLSEGPMRALDTPMPTLRATGAESFTFDDIAVWAGEGSQRAALAVQWNDGRETHARVWGYQWEGTAYGIDLLFAVCRVDPKFHVMADATSSGYGSAIAGVGYDASGDGVFFVRNKKTGAAIYPDENGVIPHPAGGYDYDDYESGDPNDFWGAGWYSSYWSYWVRADAAAAWGYSGVGASGRRLTDGCWDGWNFALGMSTRPWKPLMAAEAQGYTSGTFFLQVDPSNLKSSLSLLDSKKHTFTHDLYEAANAGEHLSPNTRFATIFGDNIYFATGNTGEAGGSIVVASAQKLENIAQIGTVDARSLIGISATTAYVGTGDGIYRLDLSDFRLGEPIAGAANRGEVGTMTIGDGGRRVFALLPASGILVIDTETHTVVQTLAGDYLSLTQSAGGDVWAMSATELIRINPQSPATETVPVPAHCRTTGGLEGSFFADVTSDVLYWANTGANATSVFRYVIGQPQSLLHPFFSLPAGETFEGAGVRLNAVDGRLLISAVQTATGKKQVYVVDASNGDRLAAIAPTAPYSSATWMLCPDQAPVIRNVASEYSVALNSSPIHVALEGAAFDRDNIDRNIRWSVASPDPELVTASLSSDLSPARQLVITPQAGKSGTGKVLLSTHSNGKQTNKNISITITRALEGIAFPADKKEIKRGSRDTLQVVFSPANATNQTLAWTREGSAVSVGNGIVTALNVGTATVRATSADGNFTAECEYTVVDAPLEGVAFDKTATTVYVNQRDTLQVVYSPADAYNKNMTWTQESTGFLSTSWNASTGMLILTGNAVGTTKLKGVSTDGGFVTECEVTVAFRPADGLTLNKSELSLTAPDTETLQALFSPAGASNRELTWTSSDDVIATVDAWGRVKGLKAGTAIITVASVDDPALTASAAVQVAFIPLTGFVVGKDTTLAVNRSFSATQTFTPTNASDQTVIWTSSDSDIATVSNGYITAKAPGEATITATTNDTVARSITITVVDKIPVTGIAFVAKEAYAKVDQYKYLDYLIAPAEATDKTIAFASEDPAIAKISSATSAYAIGVSFGTVKMSVTTTDGQFSDTCLVHIVPGVESLTVDATDKALKVGDRFTLAAAALPEAALQTVTWESSDKAVAMVDDRGIVTALAAGTALITATSTDASTVKAACTLTVSNQMAESLLLNVTTHDMWLNESFQLVSTLQPANTTNKRVAYQSSDYSVAFVGSDGRITAAGIGSALITAEAQEGGATATCTVTVDRPDYTAGVFFVNEDWFGHQNSSLNFLNADGRWVYNAYRLENPGKELGCTSQYGAIYGGRLYLVSKQSKDPGAVVEGSRLAVVEAETLRSVAELTKIDEADDNADGRAFLGVDEHKGYISTSNGIWIYDIDNARITGQVPGTASTVGLYNGQTGTMLRVGDRVFAVDQQSGVVVIDAATDVVQSILKAPKDGAAQRGYGSMALAKEGSIWLSVADDVSGAGSAQDYLIRLDPYTLDTIRVTLPAGWGVPNSWYAWTADGFCASLKENKIYWKNDGGWFMSTRIYAYDIDSRQTELVYDLADYDDGNWGLYGAGFRLHPATDEIYASLFRSFGSNTYRTIRLHPATKAITDYPMKNHYWFPALPVFPDNHPPVVDDTWTAVSLDQTTRIYLGDKATDVDNPNPAIVKSLVPGYDEGLISALVRNDSLIITPAKTPTVAESAVLTIRFNSNGRTVSHDLVVTVHRPAGRPEIDDATLSVHPNPFADYLAIDSPAAGRAVIYRLSGEAALVVDLRPGRNRIDTSGLAKGAYVLRFGNRAVKIVK